MIVDVFSDGEDTGQSAQGSQRASSPASVEIMPQQPLGIIERAQIDMQIATAKQFPRSVSEALSKAKDLACYSPLVASQCTYKVPRAGKKITGPSIRVAEIMGTSWGNLRYGGRVLSVGDRSLVCQGVCHDLETNVSVSVEVTRGIIDSNKKRYSDDMIVTTSMAGISIAIRNAIFKIVPAAFVSDVLTAAQKVARGEDQGLESRLNAALSFFDEKGIPKARVFLSLGIKGAADVTWEHIDTLLGYATAIRVEGIPVSDIFPNTPEKPAPEKPKKPEKPEPTPTPTPEEAAQQQKKIEKATKPEEPAPPAPETEEKPKPLRPQATGPAYPQDTAARQAATPPTPPAAETPAPQSSPTDVTNYEEEGEPGKTLIPESNSATAPAPETPPEKLSYSEAAYRLGQHGASWAMIYAALGLGDSGEVSEANKATVRKWAVRVSAGEALEAVLALSTPQTPPGPPTGEALYGKKKADAEAEAEAATQTQTKPGEPQLDF